MKKLRYSLLALAMCLCITPKLQAEEPPQERAPSAFKVGVINTYNCLKKSKIGRLEEKKATDLQQEMMKILQDKKTELSGFAAKFNPEYLDSISEEEENGIKNKFRKLGQELQEYERNYMQTMQQTKLHLNEAIFEAVRKASKKVAKRNNIRMITSDADTFFYADELDVTEETIIEMNKAYDALQRLIEETVDVSENTTTN